MSKEIDDLILRFQKLSLKCCGETNPTMVQSTVSQRNGAYVGASTLIGSSGYLTEYTTPKDIDDLTQRFQKLSLNDNEADQTVISTMLQRNHNAFEGASTTSRPSSSPTGVTASEDIDDLILRFQKLSLNDSEAGQTVTSSVVQSNDYAFDSAWTTSRSSAYPSGVTTSEDIDDLILRFRKLSLNDIEDGQTVKSSVLQRNNALCGASITIRPSSYPTGVTTSEDIHDLILRFRNLSLNDIEDGQTVNGSLLQRNNSFNGALIMSRPSAYPPGVTTSQDIHDLTLRFRNLSLNDFEENQTVNRTLVLRRNNAVVGAPNTSRPSAYPTEVTSSEDIDDLIIRFQNLSLNDNEGERTAVTVIRSSGVVTTFTIPEEREDLTLRFQYTCTKLLLNACATDQIVSNTVLLRKCEVSVCLCTTNLSFVYNSSGEIKDLMQRVETRSISYSCQYQFEYFMNTNLDGCKVLLMQSLMTTRSDKIKMSPTFLRKLKRIKKRKSKQSTHIAFRWFNNQPQELTEWVSSVHSASGGRK